MLKNILLVSFVFIPCILEAYSTFGTYGYRPQNPNLSVERPYRPGKYGMNNIYNEKNKYNYCSKYNGIYYMLCMKGLIQ